MDVDINKGLPSPSGGVSLAGSCVKSSSKLDVSSSDLIWGMNGGVT
jgi:hypothetical protein